MEGSIQIDSNAGKKPRMMDVDDSGKDIISDFPETIISQILSLLPTKDAVRTCVLSKDWDYKWTDIYNIVIDDVTRFSGKRTRKMNVVSFVDRIFILSRNSNLKRFRFLCEQYYDAQYMITWISAALMRNIEDLETVYNYEGVVLPRCLSYCTSLTNLKLQLPCIFRPVQNWFSKLKVLYLAKVEIVNEHYPNTSQLMFNFPVLETLKLDNCKWLKVNFVEINAPSLTKFNVQSDFLDIEKFQIKISGAKLVKFEFFGDFLGNFDLSASSVFYASVNFLGNAHDLQVIRRNGLHARLLFKGCSGLNHLRPAGDIMEGFVQSKQGHPLPKFNMLKRLELYTIFNIEAFLEFLHSAPSLEWIKLNSLHFNDYDYDLVESVPSCLVSHLNEVEFADFKGERPQIHLADFLLKNAVALKKMSGLSRRRYEERRVEKNFWARLKRVFGDGDFEEYDASRIMTRISAALLRNVENLEIVYDYEGVVIPRCLVDCIPLTKLELQLPCIFRPVQNWFSNLKVLHFDKVEILNDPPNASHLVFNFPVLETLELRECKWLKVNFVEIEAPALTKFNVIHYSDLPEVENCHIKTSGAKLLEIGFLVIL